MYIVCARRQDHIQPVRDRNDYYERTKGAAYRTAPGRYTVPSEHSENGRNDVNGDQIPGDLRSQKPRKQVRGREQGQRTSEKIASTRQKPERSQRPGNEPDPAGASKVSGVVGQIEREKHK